jgi:hypothetical protein
MLSPTDQRGTRRHAVADSQRADNYADAYNCWLSSEKEPIVRTIFSGFMLLGLLGCGDFSSTGQTEESPSEQTENQVSSNTKKQTDTKGKGSIFGRKTREILNANEATQGSNFVIVELKVQGSDPLTQSFSAYEKLAAFTGTLGIQQWVKIEKALNGQPPTYAQLQAWMKKNPGVELPVLPYQRMYGYDETKGEIVILEKRDEQ